MSEKNEKRAVELRVICQFQIYSSLVMSLLNLFYP